jgi:hypothetical protein
MQKKKKKKKKKPNIFYIIKKNLKITFYKFMEINK